jgi:hypothetical protein
MSATTTAASPTSTYVKRAIDVTVQLGQGNFGASGFNTVKLTGLRVHASILKQGAPGFGTADLRIYGMTQSVMNQLSTLGVPTPMTTGRNNLVTIEAGDAVNGMAVVFRGTVWRAWQNLDGAPETFFDMSLIASAFDAMAPVPPISFPGSADVATIMSGLALRMGRAFENNGVQVRLSNPYFPGTAVDQVQKCAQAANIEAYDDGITLAIWPKSGTRGGAIPLISAASGLVGYPTYFDQGMRFRCLYNPSILFGGQIKMQSSLTPACGLWYVTSLVYDLAAQITSGPWFCDVDCVRWGPIPSASAR